MNDMKLLRLPRDKQVLVFCPCDPLMFMRVQEFYENPELAGQIQSREVIEAWHRATHPGEGSYCEFWDGFNLPASICHLFFRFHPSLHGEETRLKNALRSSSADYVIGDRSGECVHHELTHALYSLYPEYRDHVRILMPEVPPRVREALIQNGYSDEPELLRDEANAYLSNGGEAPGRDPEIEQLGLDRDESFELQIALRLLRINLFRQYGCEEFLKTLPAL